MPERKPYPQIAAQRRRTDSTTGLPTVRAETVDGSVMHPKPIVMRLAPGIWVIIHSGLCLWSGDSHGAAWDHIENGPPITKGRVRRPKTRDFEFHTQDARRTT